MQIEYDFTVQESPEYNFTVEDNPTYDFTPSNTINITGTSDYNDLDNKPSINGNTLEGNKTLEELGAFSGDYNDLSNKPNLATVATSGSYTDLTNKPTIPSKTSDLNNDSGFITLADLPIYDGSVV